MNSTSGRRAKLLNENPHIATWFFENRQDAFIKEVAFKHLKVVDYWFRVEFEHRGSPHIHGFLWLEGAPQIDSLSKMNEIQKREVASYFGKLVCASNNDFSTSSPNAINPCQLRYTEIGNHPSYSSIGDESEIQTLVAQYKADYNRLINKSPTAYKLLGQMSKKEAKQQSSRLSIWFPERAEQRGV